MALHERKTLFNAQVGVAVVAVKLVVDVGFRHDTQRKARTVVQFLGAIGGIEVPVLRDIFVGERACDSHSPCIGGEQHARHGIFADRERGDTFAFDRLPRNGKKLGLEFRRSHGLDQPADVGAPRIAVIARLRQI